jgi:MarR family 2-MHQ and catechol resistance regulon transcriptional repressor
MTPLDRKAADLRDLVQEIVRQVKIVDEAICHGPHMELSCQELRLVEYLGDIGPKMMRELAEFLALAVNSVTSVVDNLEKKGIVRRRRSAEDRRIVHVELTRAGRAVYDAALKGKTQFLRKMLAALNEEEQEIFIILFRKIARSGRSQVLQLADAE